MNEEKPGIKTSEFWLSLLAVAIPPTLAVLSTLVFPPATLGAVAVLIASTGLTALSAWLVANGYAANRTRLKERILDRQSERETQVRIDRLRDRFRKEQATGEVDE